MSYVRRRIGTPTGPRHQGATPVPVALHNLAVWNHFLGCEPAHRLPHAWNIFREGALSPIACFAFEQGGLVTDPEVAKSRNANYQDTASFLREMQRVPLLSDLIKDARPTGDSSW